MEKSDNQRNIDGCILTLPEGLKELMSDITREVLRAQPQNVYGFIATYLSALLDVRKNISIASQVCDDISNCTCHPELDEELRNIGLIDEDVDAAMKVVKKFFETGGKETTLFNQLIRKTSIEEYQLKHVQGAVQRAFQKHRLNECGFYKAQEKTSEHKCVDNVSSISLAGSFVTLPRNTPYSAFTDTLSDISERTYDTHTSQYQESKENRPYSMSTVDKSKVLDRDNVIRFKTEIVKYINDDELDIEELIDAGTSEVESDALSVKTDSHLESSSSEE
ncbi:unnamed protein product [Colias eurytheme]|nr:unnamed protein product [Colias eurytheme]